MEGGSQSCILATRRRNGGIWGVLKLTRLIFDTPLIYLFILFLLSSGNCVNNQSYYGLVHVKGHSDWPFFQILEKTIKIIIGISFRIPTTL